MSRDPIETVLWFYATMAVIGFLITMIGGVAFVFWIATHVTVIP